MSGMRFPLRRPASRRKANPDGSMSLMEHLHELRNRLFFAVLAIGLGAAVGFMWWGIAPLGLPSLHDLLTRPYCRLPEGLRLSPNPGECQLLQTSPFEAFTIRMQVAIATGAVLTAPLWLYQIWAFITPGLYTKERRFALTFVGIASVLFAAGAVLAYFVVPAGLAFLVGLGEGAFFTALTGKAYIGFMLTLLVAFGVCFELPLLVVMLNRVGVLPYSKLRAWQRGIIFGLFVLAAVATPGSDPLSMLALALALVLLFEASVFLAWSHDRKLARIRAEQGWDDLDPDEPSPLQDEVRSPAESAPQRQARYEDST